MKRSLRQNFRMSTVEGVFAIPIGVLSLPGNVFLVALVTRVFHLSNARIGLFMALPFVANCIQIVTVPFLARRWSAKHLTQVTAAVHLFSWIMLAVILLFLPRDSANVAARWLIGWFLLSSITGATHGVIWNLWMEEWVPMRLRGKFFGRRNRNVQASALVFLLAIGWSIAHWNYAVGTFIGIVGVISVMRLVSIRCIHANSSVAPPTPEPSFGDWQHKWQILSDAQPFLIFVAFGSVWSFATNCFGAFYQVFMFEQMRMSALEVGLAATIAQLGGVLSLPVWGQLIDRYGNKPVMIVSLVLCQTVNFLWCAVGPADVIGIYALWLWYGTTGAGFILGQFTMLLRLLPLEVKKLAIALNFAVTSIFAAASPIIGGYVLERALATTRDHQAVFHVCFVVQPLLSLAGVSLLLQIREPRASPLATVVGAMRNVRTLAGILGLSFLANYLFLRPPPKRRTLAR